MYLLITRAPFSIDMLNFIFKHVPNLKWADNGFLHPFELILWTLQVNNDDCLLIVIYCYCCHWAAIEHFLSEKFAYIIKIADQINLQISRFDKVVAKDNCVRWLKKTLISFVFSAVYMRVWGVNHSCTWPWMQNRWSYCFAWGEKMLLQWGKSWFGRPLSVPVVPKKERGL